MAFNINDFTQYFDNPAVSVFDRSQNKSFPMRISKLYPAKWELLSFGNSQKTSSAHAMRVAPMVVPTLTNMRFQEHSAVVPLRSIIKNYEETFNYATNKEGASLPHFTFDQLMTIYRYMLQNGMPLVGSLFDYFGFPVFADLYKSYLNAFSTSGVTFKYNDQYVSPFSSFKYGDLFTGVSAALQSFKYDIPYRGGFVYDDAFGMPFIYYLGYVTYGDPVNGTIRLVIDAYNLFASDTPTADLVVDPYDLIPYTPFDTVSSAISSYQNLLFSGVLDYYIQTYISDLTDVEPYSTLPFRSYWRFHFDWNVNGNFVDRDIQLESFFLKFLY